MMPRKNNKQTKKKQKVLGNSEEEDKTSKREKLENMSVEKILSQIKESSKVHEDYMAKNRDLIETAKSLQKRIKDDEEKEEEYEKRKRKIEEDKNNFIFKDCKYLTTEDLNKMFHRDIQWIEDTFHGKRYCERHEMYKNDHPKNRLTSNDLMYNVSCEVFTDDQLIYLCNLFRDKFDSGNLWKYSNYYWKVLLPEYCLKIFMDCYDLQYKETMDYLNNIPVPIDRYFKIMDKTNNM